MRSFSTMSVTVCDVSMVTSVTICGGGGVQISTLKTSTLPFSSCFTKIIAFIGNDLESNALSSEDKLSFQYFQKLVYFDQILNYYDTRKALKDLYDIL
jgi:hypothetical protein